MLHDYKTFTATAIISFLLFLFQPVKASLVISAGPAQSVCIGDSVVLGGSPTASGGTAPYTYSWTPTANMNNPTSANPHVQILTTTMFYLTVIDSTGARKVDSVLISISPVYNSTAGRDTSICPNIGTAHLGSSSNQAGFNYTWSPAAGLSCTNCPQPTATPTATTTYTLIAKSAAGCGDTTQVTVTILPTPTLTVISPVSIKQGESVLLSASGASTYYWSPSTALTNPNSATPEAEPTNSTTYIVQGTGANGCVSYDTVYVEVQPDSDLVFYNTFTPNGDGINDYWYVGNIGIYPNNELTVYNRYGKQVYHAQPYYNQWDGTALGEKLPDATYYFILSTGTGKIYRGSITIIRKQ